MIFQFFIQVRIGNNFHGTHSWAFVLDRIALILNAIQYLKKLFQLQCKTFDLFLHLPCQVIGIGIVTVFQVRLIDYVFLLGFMVLVY